MDALWRSGYHTRIAELLGLDYVALSYEELFTTFMGARRGVAYVEDVWLFLKSWRAPKPPADPPPSEAWVVGRMLPIVGNLQVLVSSVGFVDHSEFVEYLEHRCSRVAFFARRGEPAATDLFLPLYATYCDVEKSLIVARRLRECGSVFTDLEGFVAAARSRDLAIAWSAWLMDAEMYPHPSTGSANLGFWGVTATVDVSGLATRLERLYTDRVVPPPYPGMADARYAKLLMGARHFRGATWMSLVWGLAEAVWGFVNGVIGLGDAASLVENAVRLGAVDPTICVRPQ